MSPLHVAFIVCAVALALAVLCLLSAVVATVVQDYRSARMAHAMTVSQWRAKPGSDTAPVGLIGRLDAYTTGQIPVVRPTAKVLEAGGRVFIESDTPGFSIKSDSTQ